MKANAQYTKGLKKHHLELMMKRYLRPFARTNTDLRQVIETMEKFVRDDAEEHQKVDMIKLKLFSFTTNCGTKESTTSRE